MRKPPGVSLNKPAAAPASDTRPPLRLLTVAEFARRSGWKPKTIYQMLWLKQLPHVRLGTRSVRLREDLLETLISNVPALQRGSERSKR